MRLVSRMGTWLEVYDRTDGEQQLGVTGAALRELARLGRAGGVEKD